MDQYARDDGPPSKRSRPPLVNVEMPTDYYNTSQTPSRVIHIGDLPPRASDPDVLEAFGKFGRVAYVVIKRGPRPIALLEYETMDGAGSLMVYLQTSPIYLSNQPVQVNYSAMQKIPRFGFETDCPARVLVITITNIHYHINAQTLYDICKAHGNVVRIAVVKRAPMFTALVEFDQIETARTCKYAINGADIYTNCCTIKAEFSKIPNVKISFPDEDHVDFSGESQQILESPSARKSLMGAPPGAPQYQQGAGASAGYGYGDAGYGTAAYGAQPPPPPPGSWRQPAAINEPYGGRPGYPGSYAPRVDPYGGGRGAYGGELMAGGPGCVLIIGGVDQSKLNCDKLFNLLCTYGNVLRIMFMKKKPELALVEMGHPTQARECVFNLRKIEFLDLELEISQSNQDSVNTIHEPFQLPDGTFSFKDFTTSKLNRYATREHANRNRPCPPQTTLHWFNAPIDMTEDKLKDLLASRGCQPPVNFTQHSLPSGRSAAGTVEFATLREATEALIMVNHSDVYTPSSHNPFVLKLAYTKAHGHKGRGGAGDFQQGPGAIAPADHPYARE